MKVYEGGCHCGNLRVAFRTALDPAQMAPRACQCAFCRKHATGAVSDPDGHLEFILKNPDQVHLVSLWSWHHRVRHLPELRRLCRRHMPDGEGAIGNVMAHVLDAHARFTLPYCTGGSAAVRANPKNGAAYPASELAWTPATLVTWRHKHEASPTTVDPQHRSGLSC